MTLSRLEQADIFMRRREHTWYVSAGRIRSRTSASVEGTVSLEDQERRLVGQRFRKIAEDLKGRPFEIDSMDTFRMICDAMRMGSSEVFSLIAGRRLSFVITGISPVHGGDAWGMWQDFLTNVPASARRCGWLSFKNVSLAGVNMAGWDLSYANLKNMDMTEANLKGANLAFANLTSANLQEAFLQGADLDRVSVVSANFQGARGIEAIRDWIKGQGWVVADAETVWLVPDLPTDFRTLMSQCQEGVYQMSTADQLQNATNIIARAVRDDIETLQPIATGQVQFSFFNYSPCSEQLLAALRRFLQSVPDEVRCKDWFFLTAVLHHTDMSGCDFRYVHLQGLNLEHLNLTDADLSYADFSGADLSHAKLHGVTCIGTLVKWANFKGTQGLNEDEISWFRRHGACWL